MKPERVTMKDIAKALGLSISTVSKALNDSYEISAVTKKLVSDFVAEHHYIPNPIAKSLKDGKSMSVGVILSTVDNHFFNKVINGIESVAYQHGYNIIINQTHESFEREVQNIQHLTSRAIDGLLISSAIETTDFTYLKNLQQEGLKIVLFDRTTEEIKTHQVKIDNYQAGYNATLHLIQNGFKHIAHINSSPNVSITKERLDGYKQALTDNNISINDEYIKFCAYGGMLLEEVENAVDQLLKLNNPPEAIFTSSDRITTKTFCYLNQIGIKIPEQIALIGFSNTTLLDVLNPSLTRIKQPAFEMGQIAMQKLINLMESRKPIYDYETVLMDTELDIRKSTERLR